MKHGRIDPEADPARLQEFFTAANAERQEWKEDMQHKEAKRILRQILKERGYDPDTGEWKTPGKK